MSDFLKYRSRILIPSLGVSLFLVLFLSLSLSQGEFLLSDADTGWHIRAGEFIWDTFSIPKHDIFSFITPSPYWMNHQWLSEVVMALIHQSMGLTGIVIFFALLISLGYYVLFKLMQEEPGNIFLALFIVLFTIVSSIFHWLARPHIFSLLFFVICYYILEAFQYRDKNYLYFFPAIILIWVNLHGGFIAGFILISIYLIGNWVRLITQKDETRKFYKKKAKALTLTLLICLFVSFINPYGVKAILYPFQLISHKLVMDRTSEFQSPNFHNPILFPFKYFLLSVLLLIGILRKNLNLIEILLILLFANMALFSQRFIPLFCVVTAPILVRNGNWILKGMSNKWVEVFQKKSEDICSMDVSARGYLWLLFGILIVAVTLVTQRIEYKFDENEKPVAAVDFLKKIPVKGNMFNDDEFGDYIIYSAFPQYKVFIDGRLDMYGADQLKDYLHMMYFKPGWEKIVEKYDFNWVILNTDSILSRYLMAKNDWRLIYLDKVAAIFVRNVTENQDIIRQYGNGRRVTTTFPPGVDLSDPQ